MIKFLKKLFKKDKKTLLVVKEDPEIKLDDMVKIVFEKMEKEGAREKFLYIPKSEWWH